MNFHKVVALVVFFGIAVGGFFINTQSVQAASVEELIARIAQLQAQIRELQAQLQAQGQVTTAWCHDFNTNLRFGDTGSEVKALYEAFVKEGGLIRGTANPDGLFEFDEAIASAVVGFQEKYKDEILTPNGLRFGTGFVGKSTRAKLSLLYGCDSVVPTPSPVPTPAPTPKPTPVPVPMPILGLVRITALSPASGSVGTQVTIVGQGFTSTENKISLGTAPKNFNESGTIASTVSAYSYDTRTLVFTIPVIKPGKYDVSIMNSLGGDGYLSFTVTEKITTQPSITITSNPQTDSNGSVTIQQGDQIVITGTTHNLSGQMDTSSKSSSPVAGSYSRAFFFDSIFDGVCSNTDWVMTCTAQQTGTSKFYMNLYQNGQTYQSNIIQVTVVSAGNTSYAAPEMVYPADGQVLNYGFQHGYMFKVKPIVGATAYRYQFFQNGLSAYDNLNRLSTNGEFAVWPSDSFYSKFQEGDVSVWIRALINGQWTDARTITIILGRSDLYPTPITTPNTTAVLKVGDRVFFDSGIGNKGPVSTGVFNIKWFVDGVQTGYGSHFGVAGNSTVMDGNSQFTWTAVEGTHTIKFVVDSDNHVVNEPDEADNTVSTTITVSPAIVFSSITSFNYTETDAYGGSVKFYWTNDGTDSVNLWIPCLSGLSIKNAVTGTNFSCGESDLALSSNSSLYLKLINTAGSIINASAIVAPIIGTTINSVYSKTINFSIVSP
jgi:hypothetical protein